MKEWYPAGLVGGLLLILLSAPLGLFWAQVWLRMAGGLETQQYHILIWVAFPAGETVKGAAVLRYNSGGLPGNFAIFLANCVGLCYNHEAVCRPGGFLPVFPARGRTGSSRISLNFSEVLYERD